MEKIIDKLLAFIASLLGGVTRETLLRTNPDPSASYGNGKVDLDLSDQTHVKVICNAGSTLPRMLAPVTVPKGKAGVVSTVFVSGGYTEYRTFVTSNTGVNFDSNTGSEYAIPCLIYGLKKIGGGGYRRLADIIRNLFKRGGVRHE